MKNNFKKTYYGPDGKFNIRSSAQVFRIYVYAFIKRFFDIVFSLIGLLVTFPLFIIMAIAIKSESEGSVFFKQLRIGKKGKYFMLYKFRSMTEDNKMMDFSIDDQVTKVGRFMRKLSIDELPQLINILKGDMSFVGPRPWIEEYYKYMSSVQKHRFDVRPGLTGLAQVNGLKALDIITRIQYDLHYIQVYSFFMDIKILIKTFFIIFRKKGTNRGKNEIKENIEMLMVYNKKGKYAKKKKSR